MADAAAQLELTDAGRALHMRKNVLMANGAALRIDAGLTPAFDIGRRHNTASRHGARAFAAWIRNGVQVARRVIVLSMS